MFSIPRRNGTIFIFLNHSMRTAASVVAACPAATCGSHRAFREKRIEQLKVLHICRICTKRDSLGFTRDGDVPKNVPTTCIYVYIYYTRIRSFRIGTEPFRRANKPIDVETIMYCQCLSYRVVQKKKKNDFRKESKSFTIRFLGRAPTPDTR